MPQSVRARLSRKQGVRLADPHRHRVGIRRLDGFDLDGTAPVELGQAAPFDLRVHVAVPAPDHVGRGHVGAVVELHALAEPEGVGAPVLGEVDLLGEQRADGAALAVGHESFHHVQGHGIGVVVPVDAGIGAADVRLEGHCDALGHGGAAPQEPRPSHIA
jgi:hypothetical protein